MTYAGGCLATYGTVRRPPGGGMARATLDPATCWSTRVEASFSCTSIPALPRTGPRRTGQCSILAARPPRPESGDRPPSVAEGSARRPSRSRRAGARLQPRRADRPCDATPTRRDGKEAPPPAAGSMAKPAIGAPTADPAVMADPCHPIISPRKRSGTTRLGCSTVAVMVGAHSTPQTVMRTAKLGHADRERHGSCRHREASEEPEDRERPVPGTVRQASDEGAGAPEREDPADRLWLPARTPSGRRRHRHRCR